jgi:predicted transcriptional regulator
MSQARFHWPPPAQAHSETSQAAGRDIDPYAVGLRAKVYGAIARAGAEGLTDLEIEEQTGLAGSTVRPRRVELVRLGLVRDSGRTRETKSGRKATIWIMT